MVNVRSIIIIIIAIIITIITIMGVNIGVLTGMMYLSSPVLLSSSFIAILIGIIIDTELVRTGGI